MRRCFPLSNSHVNSLKGMLSRQIRPSPFFSPASFCSGLYFSGPELYLYCGNMPPSDTTLDSIMPQVDVLPRFA
ncbi:unnamed protein product [Blumeria hordei]|uniref:Uncharacterized protein n=1 Tax=Blumeria hordei TaxID=2867405 RepID=A0A383USS0_BLUHO|nr:unnamed protein product [Blumeria hordei]